MDLISKNTTFSLKIDQYRRASTVHHHQNKEKLRKISSFSNKKSKKRSFSFIGASRKNRALNSYIRRRTGGPSSVAIHHHQQKIHKLKRSNFCYVSLRDFKTRGSDKAQQYFVNP